MVGDDDEGDGDGDGAAMGGGVEGTLALARYGLSRGGSWFSPPPSVVAEALSRAATARSSCGRGRRRCVVGGDDNDDGGVVSVEAAVEAAATEDWKRERVCTSASCMARTARSSSATSIDVWASRAVVPDNMP